MTDDVKALIAEARNRTTEHARQNPEGSVDLAFRLADALEAATAAPVVDPALAVRMADDYLEKHRVSESWRIIDALRDTLVRVMDGRTP